MSPLKRTPLYEAHRRLSARMVEFAGYEMPVQYVSIVKEHAAVREAAGLFDVSHMGQIRLEGPAAVAAAEQIVSCPVESLRPGRVRYGLLCNERGGVVDDVTVHRLAADALFFCVNAANVEKDWRWIARHVPAEAHPRDTSERTAMLALQGPASAEILGRAGAPRSTGLRRFAFDHLEVAGCPALVSRTGYTGGDGFELYLAAADGERAFEALLAEGKSLGLQPAGLGARDTLRLEAALPLYGHELDDETTPFEARLERFVKLEAGGFIGAPALTALREKEPARLLVGFELEGRGVPRAEHSVARGEERVGVVTSGAPSPTLGKSIGLAYVRPDCAALGTPLEVLIRGRATPARVVETPFVEASDLGSRTR